MQFLPKLVPWLNLAIALAAIILAYDARKLYKDAVTKVESGMKLADLATHLAPMIAAINVSMTDQSALLAQIKAENEANGSDNTLVDQAIAQIDAITTQANAAHEAFLAASQPGALTLSPSSATVPVNNTQQFSVAVTTAEEISWKVSPEALGTVDADGLFTAGGDPGSGTVTATLESGATESASVSVIA